MTENGFVRILAHPAYGSAIARPAELVDRLRQFCSGKHHAFWPDAVSLCDTRVFNAAFIRGHRQITDIFTTQEDIAEAIAGALRVPLGLKRGDTLVRNRTKDLESYDQYLRAKALVRERGIQPLTDGATLLEQVVARDPDYAPAWALLAQAYDLTPIYHPAWFGGVVEEFRRIVDASLPKAEAAARRAMANVSGRT